VKSKQFGIAATVAVWILGFSMTLGCTSSDGAGDANVVGKVVLDEEPVQGVGVRIVDESDATKTTNTDIQGDYRFEVLPGAVTVSLISGIPDDSECSPNTSQEAIAPAIGEDPVEIDFACESGGGGAGGAGGKGGNGGAGGAGGSGGSGTGGTGGSTTRPGFESCTACECNPFVEGSCPPGDTCAVWFLDSVDGPQVVALDGSDGRQATECLGPGQLEANAIGEGCVLVGDGLGFFTSACAQEGVCVSGVCVNNCNAANELTICTDQFALCEFDFGEVDYGACL
jgi:hypothetical protein